MISEMGRIDRDPAEIQQEIMHIDEMLDGMSPDLQTKHVTYQQAKADFKGVELAWRLLKDRRSGLQSVLRSLQG